MFKIKKYSIKFKKSREYERSGWFEVTDAYLIRALLELQEKYTFRIISVNLKDTHNFSRIIIECNKKEGQNILVEYAAKLGKYVEEVKF